MFKEWLTAKDILTENLPGFRGSSQATIQRYLWTIREAGLLHLWRKGAGKPNLVKRRGPRDGQALEFHYTCLPPEAIRAYEARYRPAVIASLPGDRRAARLGKSVLAMAEGGLVRAFILQQIKASPSISASRVQALCIARFGADVTIIPQGLPTLVPMPPLRTFQQFISNLRKTDNL